MCMPDTLPLESMRERHVINSEKKYMDLFGTGSEQLNGSNETPFDRLSARIHLNEFNV